MSDFAALIAANWPVMEAAFGDAATYTEGDGTATTVTVIPDLRTNGIELDVTWEVAAGQAEIAIAATSAPEEYEAGIDTITVNGVVWTVLARTAGPGAVYVYLCENRELMGVQHRGRSGR
ncbi:MAG TPA: hypothetical protein PK034_09015 [Rugosibacter sp.]|nr:hypothetical protein [Rugosibacter sp.]